MVDAPDSGSGGCKAVRVRVPASAYYFMKIRIGNVLKKLPAEIQAYIPIIKQTADELGTEVYLVGGPVRDLLLKRNHIDLDIMVKDDGIRFATLLAGRTGRNLTVYRERLTATVELPDNGHIDVATMRTETYDHPGVLPRVEATSDITRDLSRRDFTINAMAVQLNAGDQAELIDPFNGHDDLTLSLIRFLHPRSFIDDPTRIYRAIRFEVRFGFKIEDHTLKALKTAVSGNALKTISGQRQVKEFNLYLREPNPFLFINKAYELGAMAGIVSDHKALESIKKMFDKIMKEKNLNGENRRCLLFASLFLHHDTNEITNMAGHFGMTKKQRSTIIDTKLLMNILREDPSRLNSIIKRYGDHARMLAYIITDNKLLLPYISQQ